MQRKTKQNKTKNPLNYTNISREIVKIHVFGSCERKLDYISGIAIVPYKLKDRPFDSLEAGVMAVFSLGSGVFIFFSSDRKLQ